MDDFGMTKTTAARAAGVSIRTINRWVQEYAVIPDALFVEVGIEPPLVRNYEVVAIGYYRGYVWMISKGDRTGWKVPEGKDAFTDAPPGRIAAFWD